jgi:hypothetical protein
MHCIAEGLRKVNELTSLAALAQKAQSAFKQVIQQLLGASGAVRYAEQVRRVWAKVIEINCMCLQKSWSLFPSRKFTKSIILYIYLICNCRSSFIIRKTINNFSYFLAQEYIYIYIYIYILRGLIKKKDIIFFQIPDMKSLIHW